MKSYNNFDLLHCASPDRAGSQYKMNTRLLDIIENLGMLTNSFIVINSGYRTISHNKKVGGVAKSSHLFGGAVDIACHSSALRFLIVKYAIQLGVRRIGLGQNFIHIDIDESKPMDIIFHY